MKPDDQWFTEVNPDFGFAFSLKLKEKLHEEQSPFQKIEIYATEHWGNLMVLDGCYMVTGLDNFVYHEMMAHPALFSHAAPKRVAIIGGGDCGTLREVLKHPQVERVTQIDIDERVTRVSERYFPELCASNHDPRAELKFIDGIRWMAEQPAGSLDLIIVDSTDPVGPGVVLYSVEFFRHCRRALGPGGLLVQQSESPLVHTESIIVPMHARMREAGFDDTKTLQFPQPIYPTGWWSATLASADGAVEFKRAADAESGAIETDYYTAAVHRGALAMPAFLGRKLRR
ncbi:MAG: polyamine aminopropyltransferase [Thiotrichales bacterium]